MTEPEIRAAREQDAPLLAELLAELGYPAPPATVVKRLRAMAEEGETVLVATRAGTPVALATLHVTPVLHRPAPVGRITALVVSGSVRGEGVGRAMVEAAERLLADRGCEMVEITSNQSRTDAHAFYKRLGYDATSIRFRKPIEPGRGN